MSVQDFFLKRLAGNQFQIKGNGKTITKTGNNPQTCYSQKIIPSQKTGIIYKWVFKVNRREQELVIGIASNHKTTDGAFHRNVKDINYGYSVENGQKVSKNKYSDYGCKCNKNDKIEMILNLQKKQLSFIVNGMDQGVMYNDIQQNQNIKYKLAVFAQSNGTAITMLKYQETSATNNEEKEEKVSLQTLQSLVKNSNIKTSNNTMQKILKQLEEQRIAQQKMDKKLKGIIEGIKDIKGTLDEYQNNGVRSSGERLSRLKSDESDSICSRLMRNVRMLCFIVFVLMIIIAIVMFGFGIKKEL